MLVIQSQVNLYSSPAVSRHTSYQLLAGPYILSDSTNGGHKILTLMVLSVTLFLRSLSVSYKAFEYVEWIWYTGRDFKSEVVKKRLSVLHMLCEIQRKLRFGK